MKLLVDEMLVKTAKWLRVFGIDAETLKPETGGADDADDALIEHAKKTGRTLITKDGELAKRAQKQKTSVILVKECETAKQLAEIKKALNLVFPFPEKTRCAGCNTPLEIVPPAEKEKIKPLVPESIYGSHDKFWLCKTCSKAYWEGGHWKNITRMFERANE